MKRLFAQDIFCHSAFRVAFTGDERERKHEPRGFFAHAKAALRILTEIQPAVRGPSRKKLSLM